MSKVQTDFQSCSDRKLNDVWEIVKSMEEKRESGGVVDESVKRDTDRILDAKAEVKNAQKSSTYFFKNVNLLPIFRSLPCSARPSARSIPSAVPPSPVASPPRTASR